MGNLYYEQKDDEENQITIHNPCHLINIENDDFLICNYSIIHEYEPIITSNNYKKGKNIEIKYNSKTEKKNNKNKYNQKKKNLNNKKIPKSNQDKEKNLMASKIQNKYRCLRNKIYFQKYIKPKLIRESENYINYLLNICKNNIEIEPEEKYSLNGYKQFYPKNDPFFKFNYGKVFSNQVRIEKISEEEFSIYRGEMNINNQKHGFGQLITPKYILIGTWRNNNFTGWNRESNYKGNYIEGKFINGVVNGKGILGNKKNKYIGDFVNSIRNGKGELITDKFHYKGDFANNDLEGYGKMKFLEEGHEYEGYFIANQIEGKGIFKWKNGDKYIGEMKNGKMHGKGKYYYSNGKIFEGYFINGVKQKNENTKL